MTALPVLGGFKILKDVVRISTIASPEDKAFPAGFFRAIAAEKINLPYLTAVYNGRAWGLIAVVEAPDGDRTLQFIRTAFGNMFQADPRNAVLSLFPHKNNPAVAGTLFETLAGRGLECEALANSPSAVSVVLKEEFLAPASDALFGPFSFSAYRTPSDWKLAQKGKEKLYKEVVASYQEKRPKVYGLNYRDKQDLVTIDVAREGIGIFGLALKSFASRGSDLSFLASGPEDRGKVRLFLCLPRSGKEARLGVLQEMGLGMQVAGTQPVAMFSMTGPHFGDRYGIASELLSTFAEAGIDLIAMTCTIASIRGVVQTHKIAQTLQAIRDCFEVPTVVKKD
jgi:aspartokinase